MASKADESKQIYFFDDTALLTRYVTRENGVRQINEIFTSYSQIYTTGIIFGTVVGELGKVLDAEKAEATVPLLLGDVKSGRLKVLETKPGPVDEAVKAIRLVQSKFQLAPLDVFHLALIHLHLREIQGEKPPVFVSQNKGRTDLMRELGHETLSV